MAEDSDLEKTEPASDRRLEQAREEGQVPRSREVGAFAVLLTAAAVFWFMGSWMLHRMVVLMQRSMSFDALLVQDSQAVLMRFLNFSLDAFLSFSPLLLALILAALLSPVLMGSFNFSGKALMPDFSRLDPLKGLKRLVSWNGLIELIKALLKSSLIGGVGFWMLWKQRGELFAMFSEAPAVSFAHAAHLLNFSFMMIVLSMIIIVAVDVPFQIWQYYDRLKMTKEQVKQEGKEMEGNPEVKGRIRQLQRQAARRRMMSSVPQADVIVTNPTHFAVALSYKNGMAAPKVLAKGMGEIALKIREIGNKEAIPLVESPLLARALYRHVEIDDEIPSALYAAVAEILAYVYQLSQWRKAGGTYPLPPKNVPVPAEMMPAELSYG